MNLFKIKCTCGTRLNIVEVGAEKELLNVYKIFTVEPCLICYQKELTKAVNDRVLKDMQDLPEETGDDRPITQ
jgi:hypothetical protein